MPQMTIELSPENSRKLEMIVRQTGKSRDELLNEAVNRLHVAAPAANSDWKEAWRKAAGMWQDRDDLPDFQEMRKSWDRRFVEDEPS